MDLEGGNSSLTTNEEGNQAFPMFLPRHVKGTLHANYEDSSIYKLNKSFIICCRSLLTFVLWQRSENSKSRVQRGWIQASEPRVQALLCFS